MWATAIRPVYSSWNCSMSLHQHATVIKDIVILCIAEREEKRHCCQLSWQSVLPRLKAVQENAHLESLKYVKTVTVNKRLARGTYAYFNIPAVLSVTHPVRKITQTADRYSVMGEKSHVYLCVSELCNSLGVQEIWGYEDVFHRILYNFLATYQVFIVTHCLCGSMLISQRVRCCKTLSLLCVQWKTTAYSAAIGIVFLKSFKHVFMTRA